MGTVTDGFDKAVTESFFATLKCALLYHRPWPGGEDARRANSEAIKARWLRSYNPSANVG